MHPTSQAIQEAAVVLQRISETTPGERGRRASLVALVLRAVERMLEGGVEAKFLGLRAKEEVEYGTAGSERALLLRLLRLGQEGGTYAVASVLSDYAGGLEE